MKPDCQMELFDGDTSVGEMAHIKPDSEGGSVSFDNLIILCRNCHKRIDGRRTAKTEQTLLSWKNDRNEEIRKRFCRVYGSFEELETIVVPLLRRNRSIFESYGPLGDRPDDSERHSLWLRFEGELIANNQKLVTLLKRNKSMFPSENWKTVEEFINHAREFILTREESPTFRVNLFPPTLNSIFGLERVTDRLLPSVSALQNLVKHLVDHGKFVSLELVSDQVLKYREGNRLRSLHLNDSPRVLQTYWAGRFFRPQTTNLRLESLVFILHWLDQRKIRYRFKAVDKLTELTLNERVKVFLCYEYYVSLDALFNAPVSNGFIVVNLHGWNGGPFSQEAVAYATDIGVRTMNQKQFYSFAYKNLV